ncbi:hypothetical protein [Pontibacter litorisediminis]|uniref:hypothetical protein n=1 Tax=Pontibacter litorisediminis TaxID=1846260 RepID=UPI0023EAC4F6|nr:hypothetical protein [Pontibacter litorisediminis]
MILYNNNLITLDYDPATDIVHVGYPDLHGYLLSEVKHSIDIIVDTVRSYDIKRLFLDSTKTVISVSEEESREISIYLAKGLATTRLQKLARLQTSNTVLEERSQNTIRVINSTMSIPFLIKNFSDKTEAAAWLIT